MKTEFGSNNYSIIKLELLSIVETQKEFKGMFLGQKLKVFIDHSIPTRDALGSTSDRMYRWRGLFEEHIPEVIYIKDIDSTVADAISRLDYNQR